MAKAPKAPTRNKPAGSKSPAKSDPTVEDAEVIEEIPGATERTVGPAEPKPVPFAKDDTPPEPNTVEKTEPETAESSKAGPEDRALAEKADEENPIASAPVAMKRSFGAGPFVSLLLGGVAAAAIGFAMARYVVPEGWPFPGVPPAEDPLAAAVEAQGAEVAALAGKVDGLSGSVSALEADTGLDRMRTDLTTRLDGYEASLADAVARLDEIETRLAAVEKLAPEGSAAAQMAAEAYDRELKALREMFEGELGKVEAAQADAAGLQAQAAEAAQSALGRAALARVTAALESGAPFAEALADLATSTGTAVPQVLADVADAGLPTLAALQDTFPAAARDALDASVRAGVESGELSRFAGFLQTQLGTRSLEPKEGDDADAVLSRAEAALRQGDIGSALAELEALGAAGQPAMEEWRAKAEARKAALDAVSVLADELNAK